MGESTGRGKGSKADGYSSENFSLQSALLSPVSLAVLFSLPRAKHDIIHTLVKDG